MATSLLSQNISIAGPQFKVFIAHFAYCHVLVALFRLPPVFCRVPDRANSLAMGLLGGQTDVAQQVGRKLPKLSARPVQVQRVANKTTKQDQHGAEGQGISEGGHEETFHKGM